MISTEAKIAIIQAEARRNGGSLTDAEVLRRAQSYSDEWFRRRMANPELDHHFYRGRDRVANLAISRADVERGLRG